MMLLQSSCCKKQLLPALLLVLSMIIANPVMSFGLSVSTFRIARSDGSRPSTCLFSLLRSTASQERRDEEKRRQQRKEDVVVGKTSALRDATDYALDPTATESEWLRQASQTERLVYQWTERGMASLRMLELEKADAAFDEVFRLRPDAYLWQAGIVKFYLDDLPAAANRFAKSATIYELKFGGKASEERIWRHACELKLAMLQQKRNHQRGRITRESLNDIRSSLTSLPDVPRADDGSFVIETRKVIRIASDLFESSVDNDAGREILSRAKLRSLGGSFDDVTRFDIKMWKLNAWYYLGLHYEALGDEKESKECMKMAIRSAPNTAGNADDILHVLPLLHMSRRDWFDDDDMDMDPLDVLKISDPTITGNNSTTATTKNDTSQPTFSKQQPKVEDADPVFFDSIRTSIAKLALPDIQRALQVRGVKSSGHKVDLQQRLFESLMSDAGLAS